MRIFGDYAPLMWWGRMPVYVTTCMVIAYCAGMVFSVFARSLGYGWILNELVLSSFSITHEFKIWQAVTYVLISPISFWFLIEMLMLYFFGIEVEQFLGRRNFVILSLCLILAPPIWFSIGSMLGFEQVYYGAGAMNLAIFVAFVLINPEAEIFFGIAAKWVGITILALNSLIAISATDWTQLRVLWLECLVAVGLLRSMGVRSVQFSLPRLFTMPFNQSVRHRSKRMTNDYVDLDKAAAESSESDLVESIDPILDKIARDGIGSLTNREKEHLERARKALLKKKIDIK